MLVGRDEKCYSSVKLLEYGSLLYAKVLNKWFNHLIDNRVLWVSISFLLVLVNWGLKYVAILRKCKIYWYKIV